MTHDRAHSNNQQQQEIDPKVLQNQKELATLSFISAVHQLKVKYGANLDWLYSAYRYFEEELPERFQQAISFPLDLQPLYLWRYGRTPLSKQELTDVLKIIYKVTDLNGLIAAGRSQQEVASLIARFKDSIFINFLPEANIKMLNNIAAEPEALEASPHNLVNVNQDQVAHAEQLLLTLFRPQLNASRREVLIELITYLGGEFYEQKLSKALAQLTVIEMAGSEFNNVPYRNVFQTFAIAFKPLGSLRKELDIEVKAELLQQYMFILNKLNQLSEETQKQLSLKFSKDSTNHAKSSNSQNGHPHIKLNLLCAALNSLSYYLAPITAVEGKLAQDPVTVYYQAVTNPEHCQQLVKSNPQATKLVDLAKSEVFWLALLEGSEHFDSYWEHQKQQAGRRPVKRKLLAEYEQIVELVAKHRQEYHGLHQDIFVGKEAFNLTRGINEAGGVSQAYTLIMSGFTTNKHLKHLFAERIQYPHLEVLPAQYAQAFTRSAITELAISLSLAGNHQVTYPDQLSLSNTNLELHKLAIEQKKTFKILDQAQLIHVITQIKKAELGFSPLVASMFKAYPFLTNIEHNFKIFGIAERSAQRYTEVEAQKKSTQQFKAKLQACYIEVTLGFNHRFKSRLGVHFIAREISSLLRAFAQGLDEQMVGELTRLLTTANCGQDCIRIDSQNNTIGLYRALTYETDAQVVLTVMKNTVSQHYHQSFSEELIAEVAAEIESELLRNSSLEILQHTLNEQRYRLHKSSKLVKLVLNSRRLLTSQADLQTLLQQIQDLEEIKVSEPETAESPDSDLGIPSSELASDLTGEDDLDLSNWDPDSEEAAVDQELDESLWEQENPDSYTDSYDQTLAYYQKNFGLSADEITAFELQDSKRVKGITYDFDLPASQLTPEAQVIPEDSSETQNSAGNDSLPGELASVDTQQVPESSSQQAIDDQSASKVTDDVPAEEVLEVSETTAESEISHLSYVLSKILAEADHRASLKILMLSCLVGHDIIKLRISRACETGKLLHKTPPGQIATTYCEAPEQLQPLVTAYAEFTVTFTHQLVRAHLRDAGIARADTLRAKRKPSGKASKSSGTPAPNIYTRHGELLPYAGYFYFADFKYIDYYYAKATDLSVKQKKQFAVFHCIDGFSRMSIGVEVFETMESAEFVCQGSRSVFARHRVPKFFHTDQGPGFKNKDFNNLLESNNVVHSHSRSSTPIDNARNENKHLNLSEFSLRTNKNFVLCVGKPPLKRVQEEVQQYMHGIDSDTSGVNREVLHTDSLDALKNGELLEWNHTDFYIAVALVNSCLRLAYDYWRPKLSNLTDSYGKNLSIDVEIREHIERIICISINFIKYWSLSSVKENIAAQRANTAQQQSLARDLNLVGMPESTPLTKNQIKELLNHAVLHALDNATLMVYQDSSAEPCVYSIQEVEEIFNLSQRYRFTTADQNSRWLEERRLLEDDEIPQQIANLAQKALGNLLNSNTSSKNLSALRTHHLHDNIDTEKLIDFIVKHAFDVELDYEFKRESGFRVHGKQPNRYYIPRTKCQEVMQYYEDIWKPAVTRY